MATEKQQAANRRNAEQSTGPITEAGKAASRWNAMRHGLTARHVLLPGEDPDEFAAFCAAYLEELQPVGVIEAMLTDEVIALSWRLGRAGWIEADTWRSSISAIRATPDLDERLYIVSAPGVQSNPYALEEPNEVGRAFFKTDSENEFMTAKLSRYETRLARRRDKVLKMLFAAQDRRGQAREREDERAREREEERAREASKTAGVATPVSVPASPIEKVPNEANAGTVDSPPIENAVTTGEPIIRAHRIEASEVATAETMAAPASPIEKMPNEPNAVTVDPPAMDGEALSAAPQTSAISTEGDDQAQ